MPAGPRRCHRRCWASRACRPSRRRCSARRAAIPPTCRGRRSAPAARRAMTLKAVVGGPAFEGAVAAPALGQFGDQVAPGEGAGVDARPLQGEDRAGEVAGAADFPLGAAQEVDRRVAVRWRRPAGCGRRPPARASPSRSSSTLERSPGEAPKPPSEFSTDSSQLGGARGIGGLGAGRKGDRQREDEEERRRDAAAAQAWAQPGRARIPPPGAVPPPPLEPLAEADQHPHHRRPGDAGRRRCCRSRGRRRRGSRGPPAPRNAAARVRRRRSFREKLSSAP